jgi:hypothetical protein
MQYLNDKNDIDLHNTVDLNINIERVDTEDKAPNNKA